MFCHQKMNFLAHSFCYDIYDCLNHSIFIEGKKHNSHCSHADDEMFYLFYENFKLFFEKVNKNYCLKFRLWKDNNIILFLDKHPNITPENSKLQTYLSLL